MNIRTFLCYFYSTNSRKIAADFSLEPSEDDLAILKHVCDLLAHRTALLVGIPLAVFLERMNVKTAKIAVTGSLYKCHPRMKDLLEGYIKANSSLEWAGSTFLSDDGSGKGAGLVAAIAERLRKK